MSVPFHELRVSAVICETPECSSFELAVPKELEEAYRYKAGQHLTFELPWDDFTVTRCYSLSSCPDLREPLKIGVKRVEGGRISNWLIDNLKAGDSIIASVPEGRFVLDPATRSGGPAVPVCGRQRDHTDHFLAQERARHHQTADHAALRQPDARVGDLRGGARTTCRRTFGAPARSPSLRRRGWLPHAGSSAGTPPPHRHRRVLHLRA